MKVKGKKLTKKLVAIGLALAVTGCTAIVVYRVNTNKKEITSEVKLREYEVKRGDIVVGVNSGGLISLEGKTHKFNDEVIINEVFVKVGQEVKKGDKLASISTSAIDEEISKLNMDLKKAKINLEKEKELEVKDENSIEIAQIEVNKINMEIENLNKKKKNTLIVSKVDGTILEVAYEEGVAASKDSKGIVIGDLESIAAVVSVEEGDVVKLEKDQDVDLELTAYQDAKFKGKLLDINLKPSQDSGAPMYTVKIKIEETDKRLIEGMTLDARFILKDVRDVIILSNKAINLKDGKQVVKIKDETGELKEVEITTGFSDGKFSEITSGLNEGQVVIVEG